MRHNKALPYWAALVLAWSLIPVGVAHAAQVPISAAQVELSVDQEVRAMRLNEQLKCPVCKNQSLAASSSYIAEEMKRTIRLMVRDGKSDDEILSYFVERYSEWVLLAPPKQGVNWILYGVPPVVALGIGFVLWRRFRRVQHVQARSGDQPAARAGTASERAQQWLEQQERL